MNKMYRKEKNAITPINNKINQTKNINTLYAYNNIKTIFLLFSFNCELSRFIRIIICNSKNNIKRNIFNY